jgi:hypothetical protein
MGLFTGLLLLPLAPVRGVGWVAKAVLDTAEAEQHDPAVVRARLAELHRAYDDGEIDAEHFDAEEERLLDLLESAPAARPAPVPARTPRSAGR